LVDVEQQIQQQREQFQLAKQRLGVIRSQIPQVTQMMLRKTKSPLGTRLEVRGLQKRREKVGVELSKIEKSSKIFEGQVSSYYIEKRRVEQLAKTLGGFENMTRLISKDNLQQTKRNGYRISKWRY